MDRPASSASHPSLPRPPAMWCLAGMAGLLLTGLSPPPGNAADAIDMTSFAAQARRSGLRVFESRHMVLATDRPHRDGDGVDALPGLVDQAFLTWCRHYRLDPAACADWRAYGCLVVNRERFREAGLLPDTVPDFSHGYCDRHRFWMLDQSNPDYRRHLLLHEAVHAFTITLRDLTAPTWYAEGIAELLATHRLTDSRDPPPSGRFIATPIPLTADDVEQLGRIEQIQRLRRGGGCPSLQQVFVTPPSLHGELPAYAGSWAAVALLALHPRYAGIFHRCESGPLDEQFTQRLLATEGFSLETAARDFDAFTADVDYGYDFTRLAIDWSASEPLITPTVCRVTADRGWQNSGRRLAAGQRAELTASGRARLGSLPGEPGVADVTIESEADGISLDWIGDRPLGRLLAAQWIEKPDTGGRPRFELIGEGAEAVITGLVEGTVFIRINDAAGSLADNAGAYTVHLQPLK